MSAPSAINNAKQILVGGTPSSAITTTTLKDATFIANAGEIGIFTPEGLRILETGSSPVAGVSVAASPDMDFVLAISRGASASPIVSDVMKGSSVTVANKKAYAAATEQVTAVGYNGTSGLIADVATYAGELYKVGILVHQFLSGTDSEKLKAGYYQSQLTDGQAEIALGLANSINKNFAREVSNSSGDKPVVAEVRCNNAGAPYSASTGILTVVKGSTQVSAATAIDGDGQAVGDFWRAGLTTSDDVYKIVALDTTNEVMTLDRPYTGDSGTFAATASQGITAALGAAANWGVVLEGKPVAFDVKKKRYAKVRFDVTLNEAFGSTVASNTTNASEGNGTYEAVAQLERFLNGFRGESYEMGEPFIFNVDGDMLADSAVAGGGYNIISIAFSSSHVVSFQNEVAPKELILAIPATTPGYAGASADDITDVLEDIIPANAQIAGDLAI